jgi:hypothetical protein
MLGEKLQLITKQVLRLQDVDGASRWTRTTLSGTGKACSCSTRLLTHGQTVLSLEWKDQCYQPELTVRAKRSAEWGCANRSRISSRMRQVPWERYGEAAGALISAPLFASST